MFDLLLKNLGLAGTSTILALLVIFSVLFGFKTSYFEFQGVIHWFKNRKKNKNDDIAIDDNHNMVTTPCGDDVCGFEIPKEYVRIFGKSWNRDSINLYRMLEERWEHCNVVDITECNATTSLISLLENKAEKFGSLTIYATHEQMKLLNYLQQISTIKFEVR